MPATQQNLPVRTPLPEGITILLLTPQPEDATQLRSIFHHPTWKIEHHSTVASALTRLASCRVVVCEGELPDGSWESVLATIHRSGGEAPLIVVSTHADDLLWAKVLDCGGYDVLPKPFDRAEVTRVVMMAAALRKPAAYAALQGAASAAAS